MLFSDAFDYVGGPLVTISSGAWVHHNGSTTGEVKVVSGRVFLTQAETEDVSAALAGQPYASGANVLLYAKFTLNVSNAPSGSGDFFAHFKAAGTSGSQRGKVFVTTNGVSAGFFRVGIANGASSISALLVSNLSFHTDYTVVTRYAPSNAATALWVNPGSETDPAVTASDTTTTISVVAFALRQSFSSPNGMGGVFLDNLAMGTSFTDVLSNVPPLTPTPPVILMQPLSQIATQGDTVTFTALAAGWPPPAYQWQFKGTNIADATSASLVRTNVTKLDEGTYSVIATNSAGSTNSDPASLTVNPPPQPYFPGSSPALSLLTYNCAGNGVADWSTNSAQVQAIGRQMAYLQPDVITFQEIPFTNAWQMPDFVRAFLPGYSLATNSGGDGYIRSAIVSRHPITRSRSWLNRASLTDFGYNGVFTRDLFEAQIAVPAFEQPFHAFTTHLKSGTTPDEHDRRAAEAAAISNFFVTVFFTTNASHPYTLSGDFNESDTSQLSIQRLTSAPTGLQLTTPVNPISGSLYTFSIKAISLTKRYDYIMPGGMLATNILASQVFCTDLLTNPPPPAPLLTSDDKTASDHLPVVMSFANPFNTLFRLLSCGVSNQTVTLRWESAPNRFYHVEVSTNSADWSVLVSNLPAAGGNTTFATNATEAEQFFRIYRVP